MLTTFYNVTITVEAETAKDAYVKLGEIMNTPNNGIALWTSDTFRTNANHAGLPGENDDDMERETWELFEEN